MPNRGKKGGWEDGVGNDTQHVTFMEWLHGAVDEDIARGDVSPNDAHMCF